MHHCPQCGYNSDRDSLEDVSFIYGTQMVYRFSIGVHLSAIEMDVFDELYGAGIRGCTMTQLCDHVYDGRDRAAGGTRAMAVHISKLRSKLRKIGLLLSYQDRSEHGGRYTLVKMRAISVDHARKLEATP